MAKQQRTEAKRMEKEERRGKKGPLDIGPREIESDLKSLNHTVKVLADALELMQDKQVSRLVISSAGSFRESFLEWINKYVNTVQHAAMCATAGQPYFDQKTDAVKSLYAEYVLSKKSSKDK